MLRVKFLDSQNYPGWHKELPIKKEEPCEAYGEKVHEDETYISLAQSKSGTIFGNILRIPKVAIVSTTVLTGIIIIILLILRNNAIKGAILAFLP